METEVLPKKDSSQAELLAQGHSLVKLENNVQMQVSIQRPRDESLILKAALNELELYKSCAEEAIYNKPVGKDDKGVMKYAEGLSIRAAESLANRWGNSAYGVEKVSEDDESATLVAVFLDYEHNTRHMKQKRVSKSYRAKGGKIIQYSPDKFDTVLDANQSKILREVILRSLPSGLKKAYEIKAKELLKGGGIKPRLKKMMTAFGVLGITEAQLNELRGKPFSKFDHTDLTELQGVYNGLKDGEFTVESLFEKKKTEADSAGPSLKLKEDTKQEGEGKEFLVDALLWEEKLAPVVLKTKIFSNPIFKKKTELLSFNQEQLESFINLCTEYEKKNK